nr:MAG TPA: hypothetical protein [Caudoviricetes sp.]
MYQLSFNLGELICLQMNNGKQSSNLMLKENQIQNTPMKKSLLSGSAVPSCFI